jgi:hypothetical protein
LRNHRLPELGPQRDVCDRVDGRAFPMTFDHLFRCADHGAGRDELDGDGAWYRLPK